MPDGARVMPDWHHPGARFLLRGAQANDSAVGTLYLHLSEETWRQGDASLASAWRHLASAWRQGGLRLMPPWRQAVVPWRQGDVSLASGQNFGLQTSISGFFRFLLRIL